MAATDREGGEPMPKGPTPGKGEAGYNVSLVRTMGDTQRSPTISPENQGIAEQDVPGNVPGDQVQPAIDHRPCRVKHRWSGSK
jgi:hypothetical protein